MVWIVVLIRHVARTHIHARSMLRDAPSFATTGPANGGSVGDDSPGWQPDEKGPGWCRGPSCCTVARLAAATAEHAQFDRFGGTVGFRLCQ